MHVLENINFLYIEITSCCHDCSGYCIAGKSQLQLMWLQTKAASYDKIHTQTWTCRLYQGNFTAIPNLSKQTISGFCFDKSASHSSYEAESQVTTTMAIINKIIASRALCKDRQIFVVFYVSLRA